MYFVFFAYRFSMSSKIVIVARGGASSSTGTSLGFESASQVPSVAAVSGRPETIRFPMVSIQIQIPRNHHKSNHTTCLYIVYIYIYMILIDIGQSMLIAVWTCKRMLWDFILLDIETVWTSPWLAGYPLSCWILRLEPSSRWRVSSVRWTWLRQPEPMSAVGLYDARNLRLVIHNTDSFLRAQHEWAMSETVVYTNLADYVITGATCLIAKKEGGAVASSTSFIHLRAWWYLLQIDFLRQAHNVFSPPSREPDSDSRARGSCALNVPTDQVGRWLLINYCTLPKLIQTKMFQKWSTNLQNSPNIKSWCSNSVNFRSRSARRSAWPRKVWPFFHRTCSALMSLDHVINITWIYMVCLSFFVIYFDYIIVQ